MYDAAEKELLFSLLESATSIDVVSSLLKAKGLHYSGTWQELRDKRLTPALESGALSFEELLELLRTGEEHGRQHVFFYQCKM